MEVANSTNLTLLKVSKHFWFFYFHVEVSMFLFKSLNTTHIFLWLHRKLKDPDVGVLWSYVDKVWSLWTMNYRSWGHGSCIFLLVSYTSSYEISTGLETLPWTEILTLIIWPKSKVSGPWNTGHEVMALVYFCWSHRDTSSYVYQLATINRSWDSTLDKNLNLVFGLMDVRTYGQP